MEGMPMPATPPASPLAALASRKAAALLAPAILLLGATLAVGQTAPPTQPTPAAAPTPAATQPAATPAPKAENSSTSTFSPEQRKELVGIVKDILLNNPEILLEAQNALEAKMDKIQSERMAVAIKEHAGELYRPAASP